MVAVATRRGHHGWMTLQLVGAGLGRTGTLSLKLAIERLLGGTCHHMLEVVAHPEEIPFWHSAVRGEPVDFPSLLAGYSAIVDYPGASVWREIAAAFPDAPVLLSTRGSAADWWESARATILESGDEPTDEQGRALRSMVDDMFRRSLTENRHDRAAVMEAYDAHNAAVRAAVPADRLFEYQPGDGWGPVCAALDLPIPDEPFPHTNTREQFRQRSGLEPPETRAQRWARAAHAAIEERGPDGLAAVLSDDFVQESRRGTPNATRRDGLLGTVRVMRDMDLHVAGSHLAIAGDLHLLTQRSYRHDDQIVELLAVSAWNDDGRLSRLVEFDVDALDDALEVLAELSDDPIVRLDDPRTV